MKTEPDFRIIYHDDGWKECAACGSKSSGSNSDKLGLMGMCHKPDCPNYPILLEQAYRIFGGRPAPAKPRESRAAHTLVGELPDENWFKRRRLWSVIQRRKENNG